MVVTM
ncbi:UNVERIFIED_CONTAM: hypothetical protein GTU68_066182 [Idotea baltica]